jgi:hypothetical protein
MHTLQNQVACGGIEPQFFKQELCLCYMQKNKHGQDHFNTQNLEFQEMIKSLMQLAQQHTCCCWGARSISQFTPKQ